MPLPQKEDQQKPKSKKALRRRIERGEPPKTIEEKKAYFKETFEKLETLANEFNDMPTFMLDWLETRIGIIKESRELSDIEQEAWELLLQEPAEDASDALGDIDGQGTD